MYKLYMFLKEFYAIVFYLLLSALIIYGLGYVIMYLDKKSHIDITQDKIEVKSNESYDNGPLLDFIDKLECILRDQ